mmetsp:Transcript_15782/g.64471  ORF Transcript_15782/g.64471 Transcript_15782/m.64471 type:complete len:92 (-) Transcript_15782:98-373(-)
MHITMSTISPAFDCRAYKTNSFRLFLSAAPCCTEGSFGVHLHEQVQFEYLLAVPNVHSVPLVNELDNQGCIAKQAVPNLGKVFLQGSDECS